MSETTAIATFNLPVELMKNLKDIAAHKKVDDRDLAISYIEEGVRQDLQKVKWCDFISHTKDLLHKHNVPAEAIDEMINKFTY